MVLSFSFSSPVTYWSFLVLISCRFVAVVVVNDDLNIMLRKAFACGEQERCTFLGRFRKLPADHWTQCLSSLY